MSNTVNQDLINTYKNDQKIISDYYKLVKNGKLIDVTGIVNPLKIDNRQYISPIDNQGNFQACAGFSAATIIESIYWKRSGKLKQLDSLQVYQLAKQIDGSVNEDGTYLECAMSAILRLCQKDQDFQFLKDAKTKTFFNDGSWSTVEQVKQLLHRFDFLQVGFYIDEGWYDCNQNDYVLRDRGIRLGGHAVFLCGYDDQGFFVGNQWGTSWGTKGFAIMPYPLFLKQFMYGIYVYDFCV